MRFHVVKRDHCPLWKKACFYLLAVVAALALGAVLLLALGVNPCGSFAPFVPRPIPEMVNVLIQYSSSPMPRRTRPGRVSVCRVMAKSRCSLPT